MWRVSVAMATDRENHSPRGRALTHPILASEAAGPVERKAREGSVAPMPARSTRSHGRACAHAPSVPRVTVPNLNTERGLAGARKMERVASNLFAVDLT
ncbi:unnamed protein product, partial [Iphiclides podalirius]